MGQMDGGYLQFYDDSGGFLIQLFMRKIIVKGGHSTFTLWKIYQKRHIHVFSFTSCQLSLAD